MYTLSLIINKRGKWTDVSNWGKLNKGARGMDESIRPVLVNYYTMECTQRKHSYGRGERLGLG